MLRKQDIYLQVIQVTDFFVWFININWQWLFDLITSVSAVVIAFYAFKVSKQTAKSQIEHNQLSVRPLILPFCNINVNKEKTHVVVTIGIENKGNGPGIVKDIPIVGEKNGEEYLSLKQYFDENIIKLSDIEIDGVPGYAHLNKGQALSVNERVTLLSIHAKPKDTRLTTKNYGLVASDFVSFRNGLKFTLEYESMYGDKHIMEF